jgi:peptidoglycan/xylan/chitin deacetylase (PgdA/CDA1 family)
MLKIYRTLILFGIVMVLMLVANYFITIPWYGYGIIVLIFLVLLILGSVFIQLNYYMSSVCRGPDDRKSVALTFDDGPDGQITPLLLDILKEYQVKATFFVIGSKAKLHPDIIGRISNEGHVLGGHSHSHHFFFDLFPYRRMRKELTTTAEILYKIINKRVKLFRPPYGVTNPVLARVVRDIGLISIGWNLKTKDTVIHDPHALLQRLKRKVKPGSIILFHDNKPRIIDILPDFLLYLCQQGYSVEPLDKFLNVRSYDF